EPDGLEIVDAADGEATGQARLVHGRRGEMASGGVPGDEHPASIAVHLRRVIDEPRHRRPDLGHDLVEPRGGRQRVLDEGEVKARGEARLANERVGLLVIHLPVAAVDVGEDRRAGLSAGEDVESLPCLVAVTQVDLGRPRLPKRLAARRPARHVLVPLRNAHGRRVIVRGVERRPVHPSIEHRALPGPRYTVPRFRFHVSYSARVCSLGGYVPGRAAPPRIFSRMNASSCSCSRPCSATLSATARGMQTTPSPSPTMMSPGMTSTSAQPMGTFSSTATCRATCTGAAGPTAYTGKPKACTQG